MTGLSASEKAEKALRIVREAKQIAYDTEGSGLDWKRNFPIGYVVTDDDLSVYVPVRHGGGGNLPDKNVRAPESATDPIVIHRFERELAKAFEDRKRLGYLTIGHHMKFDCHFSANAGILLGRNLSCTQNREAILDEYARQYSLEASAERRKVQAKKGEDMYRHLGTLFGCPGDRKAMQHYWRTSGSDPIAVEYAEGDGTTTLQLWRKQEELIEEENLQTIDKLEGDLIWTLFRMERKGIRVDIGFLEQLKEKISARVERIREELPKDFNPRSPIHMKEYVTNAGREDWPTTDAGNPSFTEKWLKTFPEGKLVVSLRKWTNISNTFITPLLEEHVYNGRVHANLNQLKNDDYGTPARLSCSHPNLQQIPKRDKELAPLFRMAFLPDEGYVFDEADYSQCEPRLFAHYSEEPSLVEGYSQTPFRDMHQVVADLLTVERDPTAKRMNMGILTGMYPKTFAMHMEWPLQKATEEWDRWFKAFPGIRDFQDTATAVIKRRGFVRTLLGRRGRLDNPRFAYKATSKIIQGGNADILKYKMLELDREIEAAGDEIAQLLMTVHDAFEWQHEDSDRGRAFATHMLNTMVDVQGPPFNLKVPFVVDHRDGVDWCEATFGPEVKAKALAGLAA